MARETIHVVVARQITVSAVIKVEAESVQEAFPLAYKRMAAIPHEDWRFEVDGHVGAPELAGGVRETELLNANEDARDTVMAGVRYMALEARMADGRGRVLDQRWFNTLAADVRLRLIAEWTAELESLADEASFESGMPTEAEA